MSRSVIRVLIVPLLVVVAVWWWRASHLRAHYLGFVPPALEVSQVLYAAEEAWGWGPGGNETGIIVYATPEVARQAIETGGIPWLNGLPGRGQGWQGVYHDWHPTPFDAAAARADGRQGDAMSDNLCGMGDGIAAYMARYGFCIAFDPEVEALADDALARPGSFYAFGRIGMLLLIPAERRIIYAYNG